MLSRFENSERYFEVMLPSRLDHLERGKKAAIMSLIAAGGVGRDMIACVDADYDYLEQGASGSSKTILDNPYIFHSYAYAIENMQCYAPSLHAVFTSSKWAISRPKTASRHLPICAVVWAIRFRCCNASTPVRAKAMPL